MMFLLTSLFLYKLFQKSHNFSVSAFHSYHWSIFSSVNSLVAYGMVIHPAQYKNTHATAAHFHLMNLLIFYFKVHLILHKADNIFLDCSLLCYLLKIAAKAVGGTMDRWNEDEASASTSLFFCVFLVPRSRRWISNGPKLVLKNAE
jgi:hypothetical protein